ncbi:hypothetical protein D9619_006027 [Psilocybe cf. subviscida]|uniref:Etoposide-induced protein 2.4-domain-containing protein n=1 Tax=Psilocybe cf. subviscida TaxID=2480587 RepID=A0A8H5FBS5_9AGAR|nr:hypothetical protein D9619_006027 [Psilocybe cf. subviscida]
MAQATPRYPRMPVQPPRLPQSFSQFYPPDARSGHARMSSRASYPTFLSVTETAMLQLTWMWKGLYDSFRWNVVVGAVMSDSEIRANVYKSLMLNTVSLTSIYVFDLFLQPLVKGQQRWFHRNIGWFYQVLWLLPVVGMSLYLNGTWCTVIAKRTFLLQHGGRPTAPQPTSYTGMLKAIATSAYRVVMVGTSVVMSFVLQRIPVVGPYAGFLFLCWVDAYYCFEFVWIARGLSLSGRIRHLEERWAYYFAFGLPSALLCTVGTTLANAAIFALIFPVYIIMAMHARPVPSDPYNPSPSPPLNASAGDTTDADTIRHPSPFIPIRLPIFAPVIFVNDAVVRVLNFIGGRPIVRPQQTEIGGGGGGGKSAAGMGRGRAFSDAADSAEGGSGVGVQLEMRPLPLGPSSTTTTTTGMRAPSARVKLGARRKAD